ncbi:hypothetical protein H1V43_32105 [Streptomyces sp. PSKA54]|uniref:Uncharacterized protein n=1 Tax=Streptomyces himalayensis subsp. aureolus TaxID=2758039 RepID=A0A7W2D6Z5_9ACTN|nr:hypothetical protein [Streptomyces himalayensis]MBA4865908.1 hypothetical protein [Streptomyces himalayensis subsp. aureolus]
MGYRPPRKIYNLDFTGTDYEGLAVSMRGLTIGEELELDALREADGGGRRVFELMTGLLVEWNIEDDHGQPVPATFDGVCTQDAVMVMAILNALQGAASGVPDPLPNGSTSGEPSPVALIPTETLSSSPESSAVPA